MFSNIRYRLANLHPALAPVTHSTLKTESLNQKKRGNGSVGIARDCGRFAICFIVGVLAFSLTASLSAQTNGTISGHVSDSTGAVIPDATITLKNASTNTSRTTVTTGTGDYTFPSVPPAVYRIEVSHAGFKTASSMCNCRYSNLCVRTSRCRLAT